MPEETKVAEIQTVKTDTQTVSPATTTQPDLITRVSQVKTEPAAEVKDDKFNINELDATIEKIQDPTVKEQMLGLKKSLLRGENQKYQEIATLRKQYETRIAETSNWTPERVQQLIKNPDFVNAAKSVVESPSGDNDSMLSEKEKQLLLDNNKQVQILLQQNAQLYKEQQYKTLKDKYANFDSQAMDIITSDILNGKQQITYEHIHKAMSYDTDIQKAYKLGLEDKKLQTIEKIGGMSFDNANMTMNPERVEPEKGETAPAFFVRAYQKHTKK